MMLEFERDLLGEIVVLELAWIPRMDLSKGMPVELLPVSPQSSRWM